ncbi:hypothetical protein BJY01DRAFT_205187 [Aspergillus pseudoustus]|uniref:Uncharacterized protein n=1 Tax=Aspergillus pseudoustus TaxID=1810923 RepID=A0ABR4KQ93_9EURO
MTDGDSPPAYPGPSPDPPPYEIATDPTQPSCNQPLLNPHLAYNTFSGNGRSPDPQSEPSRRCSANYEYLAVLFFVVVIGLVILLPGLQGEGLGSRIWKRGYLG